MGFNLSEIFSAFMVLFAIIDVTGSIPIVINLKHKGMAVKPFQVAGLSFLVMTVFLIGGEKVLDAIGVDLHAFALAGAFILLIYGIEMTLGVQIMKNDDCPKGTSAIIPLVFPLIAGAGCLTTIISMRAEMSMINVLIAILLNMIIVAFVYKYVDKIEKVLGPSAIYIITKILGIILLAMASRMFLVNLKAITAMPA